MKKAIIIMALVAGCVTMRATIDIDKTEHVRECNEILEQCMEMAMSIDETTCIDEITRRREQTSQCYAMYQASCDDINELLSGIDGGVDGGE